MKELIIMYLPIILTFAVTVFNIIKTIKGLNIVDPRPHINRLESRLDDKYSTILDKLNVQERTNEILSNRLIESDRKASEAQEKIKDLESKINDKFAEQTELLTKLVRADVELKAEVRREKDDSKAV